MEAVALILLLFLIALVGAHLGSPAVKGARGERRVNSILESKLPSREYKVFHDLTLESSRGPTQIDHVVVSRYGIFVIETKNYAGWIFGSARSRQWTQVIYREKNSFQNPLHQNFKHTKAVESFLSLSPRQVHSIVVFVGDAEFKTDLPDNVVRVSELGPYIASFQDLLLDTNHVRSIAMMLGDYKEGRKVQRSSAPVIARREPHCPKCDRPMVLRKARKGKSVGKEFWGCPGYPKCRGVRNL